MKEKEQLEGVRVGESNRGRRMDKEHEEEESANVRNRGRRNEQG